MIFMLFAKIEELDFVQSALRTICAWLCEFIYPLIAKLFQLFLDVSKVVVLTEEQFDSLYKRFTVFLTVVMMFYITFEFVKYLMQPDMMEDKEKGVAGMGKRIVIVILLIAFTPDMFKYAWKLQDVIIGNDVIPRIILGTGSSYAKSAKTKPGNNFAATMLHEFYEYSDTLNDADDKNECSENIPCRAIVNGNIKTLQEDGETPNLLLGLNASTSGEGGTKIPLITFNGIFAVGVGIFILYILIIYTIEVAKRVFQLTYLQIIAPIPIMGYLSPKKDNLFSKWLKQCTTTYLDLFIRLMIMYFFILISNLLGNTLVVKAGNESITEGNAIISSINGASSNRGLIYIFLILGLLIFVQKVPKLIEELFPKMGVAGGNFGLKAGERVAPLAARAIGASYGGLRRLAGGAIARGMNAHRRNKAIAERTGKTKKERKDEAKVANEEYKKARSAYRASQRNKNRLEAAARREGASQETIQRAKEAKKVFEKNQAAMLDKETQRADAMGNKNKSIFGNAVAGGLGGAYRGAKAGLGATKLEDIGKKAREGAAADKKNIAAREEWLNAGGYNEFERIGSGIAQSMGITTAAQLRERDVKTYEALAKREKTLMQRESAASKSVDTAKDAVKKRIESNKDKATIKADEGSTHRIFRITDANGDKYDYDIEVGTEGKNSSQIIMEEKAKVDTLKTSAEAAQAEVEKMRARKTEVESRTTAWNTSGKQATLDAQKAQVAAMTSNKASRTVWSNGEEQALTSAQSKKITLQQEQEAARAKGAAALATWNLEHQSELESATNLTETLQRKKNTSWTQEDEQQLIAAQRQVVTLETERKESVWEDEATLTSLETDANTKTSNANLAEDRLSKLTTAVTEDVYQQVLEIIAAGKTPDSDKYHGSYVNEINTQMTLIHEAARDEGTRNAIKAALEEKYGEGNPEADRLMGVFESGNISKWKDLDALKVMLDRVVNQRNTSVTEYETTAARMTASSQYAAEQADDKASKPGS